MSPKILDSAELDAREQVMLRSAFQLIAEEGVSGLTIDKLVNRIPYSKGTVYNHFSGKEDLLTGLCIEALEHLSHLFQRAAAYPGNSRERITAIGFAYMLHAQINPVAFMLVITAKTPSIWEKTSDKRQQAYQQKEDQLLQVFLQVICDAISVGDLSLPASFSESDVAFALWANCFGTIALLQEDLERCAVRQNIDMEPAVLRHCSLLLNSFGWLPLHQDPEPTIEQLKTGLFKAEIEQLEQRLTAKGQPL